MATTMMTDKEMGRARAWYDFDEAGFLAALPEEQAAYVTRVEKIRANAETKLAEAIRYRPSYMPEGQLTKSEKEAQAVYDHQLTYERYIKTLLGRAR